MRALRFIGLGFATLLLLGGWAPEKAKAEPRVALVIGNSSYGGDLGELPNPANDARLMAKTLKGIGFAVIEAEDADQAKMKRVIQEFGARLAESGGGATGLFFYAGHGLQVGGTNYLIPIHARIEREGDADLEAIAVDLVMKQMAFADAAVNIVILDACRNNPLSRGLRAVTRGLADPSTRPMGSFIAYSTAPGDVAEDGQGNNSPYTTALATAITRPGASINDVFQEVRGKVLSATNKKQVPWDASSLTAPFYFVPAAAAAPAVSNAVDPKAIDLAFWNAIKDSKSAEDYQAYLTKFPDGVFAPLAQSRLKQADQAATRVVPQSSAAVAPPAGTGEPEALQFEKAFWDSVRGSETAEDYQAYLKKYPNGLYADQAQQHLLESGKAQQQAAVTPTPPKPLPEIVPVNTKLYAKDKARLREAPATDGAVLAQLTGGTPLEAIGRSADDAWWRVTLSDGRAGFVAAAVVDTSPPPVAVATSAASAAAKTTAPEPDPQTATVEPGREKAVCLDESDSKPAERMVACRRLLEAGLSDETQRYNAQLMLGNALSTLGKNDPAIAAYRAAIEIDPQYYGAFSGLGATYLTSGRYAEARTALDKAVALNPEDAYTLYQRGTTLANLGEFDRARPDLEQAIRLNPDDVTYYDQLGAVDLAQGDTAAALAMADRGAALSASNFGGAAILTYYLAGKHDRAIAMAELGIKDTPDYPYFYIWKALAQKAAYDDLAAIATLTEGARAFGTTAWPAPLMDYLAGQISESKLSVLAASNDPKVQAERLCEIGFYTGEVAAMAGDKATAKAALQTAIATRVYRYLEFAAAKARLAQLQ
jgi:lipoprotein NlpI